MPATSGVWAILHLTRNFDDGAVGTEDERKRGMDGCTEGGMDAQEGWMHRGRDGCIEDGCWKGGGRWVMTRKVSRVTGQDSTVTN
jgi:hypothetical protein